jgi:hypothetical protein
MPVGDKTARTGLDQGSAPLRELVHEVGVPPENGGTDKPSVANHTAANSLLKSAPYGTEESSCCLAAFQNYSKIFTAGLIVNAQNSVAILRSVAVALLQIAKDAAEASVLFQ